MWLFNQNTIGQIMRKLALPIALLLALSGCFRPLYAQLDPDNVTGSSSVYVETIDGEIGQILQTELQFLLKSVRDQQGRSLRLRVTPAQSTESYFVDVDRNRERLGATVMEARYFLMEEGNVTPLASGIARSSATFEADTQVNNHAAATKDAGSRAAKQAARIIVDRIAAHLNLGATEAVGVQ